MSKHQIIEPCVIKRLPKPIVLKAQKFKVVTTTYEARGYTVDKRGSKRDNGLRFRFQKQHIVFIP